MINFDEINISEKFTNFSPHPDTKRTAAENMPLFKCILNEYKKIYSINRTHTDNLDLYYFAYLRAISDYLNSDKEYALATFINKSFQALLSQIRTKHNRQYRATWNHAIKISLDKTVEFEDGAHEIHEIIIDNKTNLSEQIENTELIDEITTIINEHENNFRSMSCKRTKILVSWWTIFKLWIFECGTYDELYNYSLELNYITPKTQKDDIRKVIYHCRQELKKELAKNDISRANSQ